MKIGFIDFVMNPDSPIGTDGLSEVVWNLAGPLAAQGNEVHVVGPYNNGIVPFSGVHVHSFKLPFIGYRNILGHILIVLRAIKVLKKYGPFDVIHAPEYLTTALLSILYLRTPIVLTEPGNIYDRIANGNPFDFYTTQVYKLAARITARRCTKIITTSEVMDFWWKYSGAKSDRIIRIPLGVNLSLFSHVEGAKAKLNWDASKKNLLFTARLSVETGAQYLVEALQTVLQAFPDTYLHIVGSGLFEPVLQAKVAELKLNSFVQWHGWVPLDQLATYYSAADIMIFSGTSGGTPRVMLQAMACHTPFVGSAIGGIIDHVQTGTRGWLVPPRQPENLAETIIEVLSNQMEAQRRADNAYNYIQSLGWTNIAHRVYFEVYQPLINRD